MSDEVVIIKTVTVALAMVPVTVVIVEEPAKPLLVIPRGITVTRVITID
jgi:hypothetical protein